MRSFTDRFFGPTPDTQIASLLVEMAKTGQRAADVLMRSNCKNVDAVIKYEHEGDALERRIHELLDSTFEIRGDKRDVEHLSRELDDVLDGIRRTAKHVDIYKRYFIDPKLPKEAVEILATIVTMTELLVKLTTMLQTRHADLQQVNTLVDDLDKYETLVDGIRNYAQTALVEKHGPRQEMFEFTAWDKFYYELENITDSAARCGLRILSIARK